MKPKVRPQRPEFSSGPCAKPPGWTTDRLRDALLGRSHRAKPSKQRLQQVIERSKTLLEIPDDYRVGIVAASDTGAIEMALWSMLGERPVDMLAWESFGEGWITDVQKQLKLQNVTVLQSDYGELPDLSRVDFGHDVVFTWNGTTSGVCVPDGDWIPQTHDGLVFCDATSAVFAMELPWSKLDVVTWSWQKVLGGEAAHGMLTLSPRAVARLESFDPGRPLPKIFRMTKGGKLIEGLFKGETINTPSMLCVEDALAALEWVESSGGCRGMRERSAANLAAVREWVDKTSWIDFLAREPATRSSTSICLQIVDPWFTQMNESDRAATAKKIGALLDAEGVAYDIGSYKAAPPGLRIWGGSTVETSDIEALLPWLDWAFAEIKG
ncbi:MAG: phosphoserine transaminase [Deltaproteobacteria bacterium]|nr:phosphoserine transaminase [Deltaproteobacteria bacterium]